MIMTEQNASRRAGGGHRRTVLVTAASRHGATAEIAEAIGKTLTEHGCAVTVAAPGDVAEVDGYDAVIIGSAVYVGHWLDAAKDLVDRQRSGLATRPVWLFSSGPVGDPAGKLAQGMAKDPAELSGIRAVTTARGHQMFAGKLDRASLGPVQRAVLLAFPGLHGDFRDWGKIRNWADGIAGQLTTESPGRAAG
jgi:menaquinone-dependent protoporphyrinogen oxidase